jgi:hypothetical protein
MIRTNGQNKRFWALVNNARLDKDTVRQMVYEVSDGRTETTKELEVNEMTHLISIVADRDAQLNNRSRASVCHLLALWKPKVYQNGDKLNMEAINATVQALGCNKEKKALYHLSGAALNDVVTQVKAIYGKEVSK